MRSIPLSMLAVVASVAFGGRAAAQSVASFGQTANQAAVGADLDRSAATTTDAQRAMVAAVGAQSSAAGRAAALGQLSPQAYSLLPRFAIQSIDANQRMLHNYLVERRSMGADAPDTLALTDDRSVHMTLFGDVRQAGYNQRADRPKANSDSRSIAFAIDVTPKPGMLIGLSLGIDGLDTGLDTRVRPRSTIFNSHIGPYFSINNGRVYFDASASYNRAEYRLRRQVAFTGFGDALSAQLRGDSWGASGETGYLLKAGRTRIQPYVGIHYRYADLGGFQESGGAAALQVSKYHTMSLRSSVGARLSTTIAVKQWSLRPAVSAEWSRELRGKPDTRIEARFASGDGGLFIFNSDPISRNVANVSAGVTATYKARTSFRIAYVGEVARDHHINGFMASIGRRF